MESRLVTLLHRPHPPMPEMEPDLVPPEHEGDPPPDLPEPYRLPEGDPPAQRPPQSIHPGRTCPMRRSPARYRGKQGGER
ncbi:conserved protein of unknown function [Burkholderia multivorans]